jgi:WD40 repeat protein
MTRTLFIAALLSSSGTHAAKPPAPVVGTNAPEVVYTVAGRTGYELRVANADGTGAVTLFKAAGITIGKFGPRAGKTIAAYGGNDMYLVTYDTSTGVVTKVGQRHLFNNGRSNGAPSPFDYDGTNIAWWSPDNGDIRLYNVQSGAERSLVTVPNLAGISFSSDGSEVFYGDGGASSPYLLYRISIAGGAPTRVPVDTNVGTFDSGHRTNAFAIAAPVSGVWRVTYVPAGASAGQLVVRGIEASFNCDDTDIIYRLPTGNNGYDTLKYNIASGTSRTFSTDNAVKFASYMPDCA